MKMNSFAKYSTIIGWGTGDYYLKNIDSLNIKIDFLVDKDKKKQGKYINNTKVFATHTIKKYNERTTLIIVFSMFYYEIIKEIEKEGDFDFIQAETLIEIQSCKEIDKEINFNGKYCLTICRNNFMEQIGGTSKFIREQMEILNNNNINVLHMYWRKIKRNGENKSMAILLCNGHKIGICYLETVISLLSNNISNIIIHNLISLDYNYLELLLKNIKYNNLLYYIHDFSCICSSIKMIYNNNMYCNGIMTKWSLCESCTENTSKNNIYSYHKKLFDKNIILICPSDNTKNYIRFAFDINENKIKVLPHFNYRVNKVKEVKLNKKIRIAYVGYRDKEKGWNVFREIVEKFKGKYDFYCLGKTDDHIEGVKEYPVSFIENGTLAMVDEIKKHKIDVAVLWATWPETYSYTYYECYAANTFIITSTESGNIQEQIIKNKNGVVYEEKEEVFDLLNNENKLRELITKNKNYIDNITCNDEFLKYIE